MSFVDFANPQDRTIGVYRIVNSINGHAYVGSSSRVGRRIWTHLNALRKGSHHSVSLQRAFAKYGELAFGVEIVAVCVSATEALDTEQQILTRNFGAAHCYNTTGTARSPMLCPATREKARQGRLKSEKFREHAARQIAALHEPEARAKCIAASLSSAAFQANSAAQGENLRKLLSKPVIRVDLITGCEVRYSSGKDAMRAIGAKTHSLICRMANSGGVAYGYGWRRDVV